jgi:hypothetical protein
MELPLRTSPIRKGDEHEAGQNKCGAAIVECQFGFIADSPPNSALIASIGLPLKKATLLLIPAFLKK